MKFAVDGKYFMELIKRVSVVVPKKAAMAYLETIKITAKTNGSLIIQATDIMNYATINGVARVFEAGETWVNLADLKKIASLNDEIVITVDGTKFEIHSWKKSYLIPCVDYSHEGWVDFEDVDNKNFMCEYHDDIFVKHLSKINYFRDCSSSVSNMLCATFYLDLPNRKIVALDGHRIGIANIDDGKFDDSCKGLMVDGSVYTGLKSIIGKDKGGKMRIYSDGKHVKFTCEDWIFVTRQVDGMYFHYESFQIVDFKYEYTISGKELGKIAKEYSKVIKADDRKPMIFYNIDGRLAVGINTPSYATSDILETMKPEYGMDREWYAGFNPCFIADACGIFDGDITINGNASKNPITLSDDTYTAIVLPVNITEDVTWFVRKQVA